MLAALIAAGAAAVSSHAPVRSTDQRINLLEARQMLQSQTLWTLQASIPQDAAKALNDLDLHLQEDRERDEKLVKLEGTVAVLEQRLQAIELLLGDRSIAEGGPLRVAQPTQISAIVLKAKPQAKVTRKSHSKAQAQATKSRSERMSAQQP